MNEMELQIKLDLLEATGYDQSYLEGFAKGYRDREDRISGMERREVTFRSEIDSRDNFIQRLLKELSQHGWNPLFDHLPQDQNIVALLEEGGFQYDRTTVTTNWERNEVTLHGEIGTFLNFITVPKIPENAIFIIGDDGKIVRIVSGDSREVLPEGRVDASPAGGDREPGERQDPVGRRWSGQEPDDAGLLYEEGGTS